MSNVPKTRHSVIEVLSCHCILVFQHINHFNIFLLEAQPHPLFFPCLFCCTSISNVQYISVDTVNANV